MFGLLFGQSACPDSWQGIRGMLHNQAKLTLSLKQLIVLRFGIQLKNLVPKSERSKFLFKTVVDLPSVVDLFTCLLMG